MTSQHTSDAFRISEGDTVTLETSEGGTLTATCIEKESTHSRGEAVWEIRAWILETEDGREIEFRRMDGLKSGPGESPFPEHIILHDRDADFHGGIPDEANFGYITEVRD